MSITWLVSKFEMTKFFNFERFENISDISLTLFVSNFYILIEVNKPDILNIPFIFNTFLVLKLLTSILIKDWQNSNI